MSEETKPQPAAEPVLAIYADGRVALGAGYTVADLLRAVDLLRQHVLAQIPNPPRSGA